MRNITRQEWYGALIAVLVLAVLLSFASPYFLSTRNLSNILVQASVVALLAGGQTFVILTGGVDLAVGALTALCGAYAGYMMVKLEVLEQGCCFAVHACYTIPYYPHLFFAFMWLLRLLLQDGGAR